LTCDKSIISNLSVINNSKYLGVVLDEGLSFRYYINNLDKKLSRSVGMLEKVKPFLNN